MKREYPEAPLVGVGIVLAEPERVLLIQRQRPPLVGFWTVPGGLIETGESLRVAAQREMLEETGLQVELGPVVEVVDRIEVDEQGRVQYHYVIVDLLARTVGEGAVEAQAASDAAALAWVAWEDVGALTTTPGLLPVLDKARRLLAAGAWAERPVGSGA